MDDYEIDDIKCLECGYYGLRSRNCDNWCNNGYHDEYDYDPINFYPGELMVKCQECKGTGIVRWCPNCGKDWSGHHFNDWDERDDENSKKTTQQFDGQLKIDFENDS